MAGGCAVVQDFCGFGGSEIHRVFVSLWRGFWAKTCRKVIQDVTSAVKDVGSIWKTDCMSE